MRLIGIDCAVNPRGVGVALAELDDTIDVQAVHANIDDPWSQVADWIEAAPAETLVAVDAPATWSRDGGEVRLTRLRLGDTGMAWLNRETVKRNLIGLLAVLVIVLVVWLLLRWLLVTLAILVPCVIALLWVSKTKGKPTWQGQVEIHRRRRRDHKKPKRPWRRRGR